MKVARVPYEPPDLASAGWRALLDVLVSAAEAEYGPDWRAQLARDDEAKRTEPRRLVGEME